MMKLINKTELPVTQLATLGFIERLDIAPADHDLAARRGIEPAQQMQQGALARTGRTDDGDVLAFRNRKIDAQQYRHLGPALQINLAQVAASERGITHSAMPRRD